MGRLQRYSVSYRLQISGYDMRLLVTSAMEDAWYVPWSHGGCLVHTTKDAQHPTYVTKVRRLHVESTVCT